MIIDVTLGATAVIAALPGYAVIARLTAELAEARQALSEVPGGDQDDA